MLTAVPEGIPQQRGGRGEECVGCCTGEYDGTAKRGTQSGKEWFGEEEF